MLHGTEVKSLRMGKCSIKESFIRVEDGEMYIYGMHISPYEKGNIFNKDPLRVRKLTSSQNGDQQTDLVRRKKKEWQIVPLKVYFSGSLVKWRLDWQKVRNYMTSVMISRKKTRSVKQKRIQDPQFRIKQNKIRNFG